MDTSHHYTIIKSCYSGVMVGRTETVNSDGRGWGCACARVCVCVHTSVHACMRDVFVIYDDNILSRLIMIIIKIIILYFIQIRHTDDFPSAGIPASMDNDHHLCISFLYMYDC